MGKKKINIALIILVLGLWGTVIYKSINQYFFPNELALNDTRANAKFNFNQIKKDTFDLTTIRRDPFLNKAEAPVKEAVVVRHNPIRKTLPVVKPKPMVMWPSVSYYGYIKSKVKTEELVLVKIDNRLHKLRKNDEVDGLFVKKVYNDSIEVQFNKEKRIIRLNHNSNDPQSRLMN